MVAVSPSREDAIEVYDTTEGTLAWRVRPQGQYDSEAAIADDGTLVVQSTRRPGPETARRGEAVELFRPAGFGAVTLSKLPRYRTKAVLAPRLAVSPDGTGAAFLSDRPSIAVFDTVAGAMVHEFSSPIPPASGDPSPGAGVVWVDHTRFALVGEHFVTIWSVDGSRLGEYVVPS